MRKKMEHRKNLTKRSELSEEASWKRAGWLFRRADLIDELVRLAETPVAKASGLSKDFYEQVDYMIKTGRSPREEIALKKKTLKKHAQHIARILYIIDRKGLNEHELKRVHMHYPITLQYLGFLRKNQYIDEKGNITKKGKQLLRRCNHLLR